jgi:hypothetical protein
LMADSESAGNSLRLSISGRNAIYKPGMTLLFPIQNLTLVQSR